MRSLAHSTCRKGASSIGCSDVATSMQRAAELSPANVLWAGCCEVCAMWTASPPPTANNAVTLLPVNGDTVPLPTPRVQALRDKVVEAEQLLRETGVGATASATTTGGVPPLTAAALADFTPTEQIAMIGERLYPLVVAVRHGARVTGVCCHNMSGVLGSRQHCHDRQLAERGGRGCIETLCGQSPSSNGMDVLLLCILVGCLCAGGRGLKVTGMLMEMPVVELLRLLEDTEVPPPGCDASLCSSCIAIQPHALLCGLWWG